MELSSIYYKEAPYVLIGIGAVIVLVGSLGCCCTVKGNAILLYMVSFNGRQLVAVMFPWEYLVVNRISNFCRNQPWFQMRLEASVWNKLREPAGLTPVEINGNDLLKFICAKRKSPFSGHRIGGNLDAVVIHVLLMLSLHQCWILNTILCFAF